MSNRMYDIIKFIAQIILPALGTLYFALSQLWGWRYGEEVIGTISALDVFFGAILHYLKSQYDKEHSIE